MALRSVANDSDLPAHDEGEIGILVVIDFHRVSLVTEFRL